MQAPRARTGLGRALRPGCRWRPPGGHVRVDHDQRGGLPGIADPEGEHGRGCHHDAANQQGLVVAGVRRQDMRYLSGNQVVGAGYGDGGEDGEAERARGLAP
jgi:hypothetical protein